MDIYRAQFGARLSAAIDAAGVKQSFIADELDVKPSTVSRWVNGKDHPDEWRLPALAKLLNTTVEVLTGARAAKPTNRPNPRDMRALIEAPEQSVPYGPLAKVLAEFAAQPPGIRASVLATLYGDTSIAAPYIEDVKVESKTKTR